MQHQHIQTSDYNTLLNYYMKKQCFQTQLPYENNNKLAASVAVVLDLTHFK